MSLSIKKNTKNIKDIVFRTKKCTRLTDEEIKMCSNLFSQNYGKWGKDDPRKREGQRICLDVKYYKNNMCKADHYVSLAYYDEKIIGQAFYIRKNFEDQGYMSWVLQLVVDINFRKIGIGKRLLYSIWGFSGDEAWGLATSNPYTVKTLESATFRKVCPEIIKKNLYKIKKIGSDVPYVKSSSYEVDLCKSIVNTEFYIDTSDTKNKIHNAYGSNWKLGKLPSGHEWLAFTFKDQELRKFSQNEFDMWIGYSENELKEAYSRMNTTNHPWAKSTSKEVNFIINKLALSKDKKIADFGCGIGRHCVEFFNKGYNDIIGVDFVDSNIEKAKKSIGNNSIFLKGDCRHINLKSLYDVILCLYDVIGSFPVDTENEKILKNIYNHLKYGGYAVISVMNMELTEKQAKYVVDDIRNDPKKLLNLKPSNIMQKTGNIFDAEYYIIDKKSKLVYRKEQFDNDGDLSAEHVIRDKRYTKNEIYGMCDKIGFTIKDVRFVRSGEWENRLNNTDPKAKEILLILQK